MLKKVSLEEKLVAQVKNIVSILKDENTSNETKIMLLNMQADYLNEFINVIISDLKEEK